MARTALRAEEDVGWLSDKLSKWAGPAVPRLGEHSAKVCQAAQHT